MSGGTLISMAADEIVMSRFAILGPIDPQIGQYPAVSWIKAVEQKPIERVDDQSLVMADIGRKAISQVKKAAQELLSRHLQPGEAEAVAEKMSTGTWTHDYPITAKQAVELGLPVSTDIPNDVLELMKLYPQPTQKQIGGVEYLPVPRQKEPNRSR